MCFLAACEYQVVGIDGINLPDRDVLTIFYIDKARPTAFDVKIFNFNPGTVDDLEKREMTRTWKCIAAWNRSIVSTKDCVYTFSPNFNGTVRFPLQTHKSYGQRNRKIFVFRVLTGRSPVFSRQKVKNIAGLCIKIQKFFQGSRPIWSFMNHADISTVSNVNSSLPIAIVYTIRNARRWFFPLLALFVSHNHIIYLLYIKKFVNRPGRSFIDAALSLASISVSIRMKLFDMLFRWHSLFRSFARAGLAFSVARLSLILPGNARCRPDFCREVRFANFSAKSADGPP